MTASLEGWPTKAPSPYEVRLVPLNTNPVFQSLGGKSQPCPFIKRNTNQIVKTLISINYSSCLRLICKHNEFMLVRPFQKKKNEHVKDIFQKRHIERYTSKNGTQENFFQMWPTGKMASTTKLNHGLVEVLNSKQTRHEHVTKYQKFQQKKIKLISVTTVCFQLK